MAQFWWLDIVWYNNIKNINRKLCSFFHFHFHFLLLLITTPININQLREKEKIFFSFLDYYIQFIMIGKWRKKNLLIINECSRYHSFLQKKILAFGSLMNRKKITLLEKNVIIISWDWYNHFFTPCYCIFWMNWLWLCGWRRWRRRCLLEILI